MLHCAMRQKLKALLLIIASAASSAMADAQSCPSCAVPDSAPKELTVREKIRADREKYDRENVGSIARPWDGLNLGKAKAAAKN